MKPNAPIGIFDSVLGGLAVLREVNRLLPNEDCLFLGDTMRQPYGPQTVEQVRQYSIEITAYLIEQGAKIVLIGCNTASIAGGDAAQACFPDVVSSGTSWSKSKGQFESQTAVVKTPDAKPDSDI